MNWDDLRHVLAVSRHRTLSASAAALGVTHTTVSRRLRACEDELGVRLFDRTPDGLFPTPAGQDLVQVAERLEGEVLSAEGRIMGRDAQLRGKLRISTLDILFAACRDAFASFVRRYPSVEVTVTASLDSVSLSRREADIALRLSTSPPQGLVGRRIGRLALAIYGSPALVEAIGEDAGYAAYPWIGMDEGLDARWLELWIAANAPGARVAVRADENAMLARQMVLAGMGVYFLPVWEGEALGLRQVGPILRDVEPDVWLLTHPDLQHTSRVRAFMDHMGEALPSLPLWLDREAAKA